MNRLLQYVDISDEVVEAIDKNIPIVALETTFVTHGMPYPENLDTILETESIIRESGAVPASLAVIDGRIKIGLSTRQLKNLATSNDVIKMSRRDLPICVANGLTGTSTVATAILISNMAGIKMLITGGGFGGVHKNGQNTMDISRDLQELAKNDICLVCGGAKTFLDIGLTLEYLETFGVPVLGYKTKIMPSFYTSSSDYELDYRLDSPIKIGQTVKTKWDLGLDGGVIVANPIADEHKVDQEIIDKAIEQALDEMNKEGIHGKDATPYLFDKVMNLTDGASLKASINLLKENAKLASEIAHEVYRIDY